MTLSRTQTIGLIVTAVIVAILSYALWLTAHPANPYKGLVTEFEVEMDESSREYFEQRLATSLAAITAVKASGQEVELNLYLGAASDAYALGDLVTARELLEKQLVGNPLNFVTWNNYALVLEKMEAFEEAEAAFVKTLELERGIEKYHYDYANFLTRHFPERRDDLKAVLDYNVVVGGQTVWNMVALADWYAAGGECGKASDHYEVAVVLDPNSQSLKDDKKALELSCEDQD